MKYDCLCLLDEQCIFMVIGFQSLNLSVSFKNKLSVVSFHTIWKVWHNYNDKGDREKQHCWLKWLMFQKPAQKSFQESSEDTFIEQMSPISFVKTYLLVFLLGLWIQVIEKKCISGVIGHLTFFVKVRFNCLFLWFPVLNAGL